MTRMVLVRHGETEDNRAGVLQGQAGKPLSAEGHRQAKRLAERFAAFRFDACYSSDLPRARETAEHLVAPHELVPLYVRALREVYVGSWQGKTPAQVKLEFPDEHAAWSRGEDIARGGGESYEDVAVRCGAALGQIAEAFPTGHVLVVSHGAALRATVHRLLGLPWGALGSLYNASICVFDFVGTPPAEDAEVSVGPKTHVLHVWNDTGHEMNPEEDALCGLLPRKSGATTIPRI